MYEFLNEEMQKSRLDYVKELKKPITLQIMERFDAARGTNITKSTRDIFMILAFFAAAVDGKVSEQKVAEISRMNAVFEAKV